MQEGRPVPKSVVEEVQEEEWSHLAKGLREMEPVNRGNNVQNHGGNNVRIMVAGGHQKTKAFLLFLLGCHN